MTRQLKRIGILWISASALLIALLIADSRLRLVRDKYELSLRNLPAGFDGFRIVQLSDLHGATFGRDNVRLLRAVREAKPELIALTGDFIDDASDLETVSVLLKQLGDIAPVYFVSGNHDWSSGKIDALAEIIRDSGAKYLRNEYILLERGGDRIVLCGVEDPNGRADMVKPDALTEGIAKAHKGAFVLLLAHRNFWAERYPNLQADLILCGHSHGGIVRLPFIGGLFGTGGELFPKYSAGLFRCGRFQMLVSRGLGNGPAPFRFLNNPQVAVITLRAE